MNWLRFDDLNQLARFLQAAAQPYQGVNWQGEERFWIEPASPWTPGGTGSQRVFFPCSPEQNHNGKLEKLAELSGGKVLPEPESPDRDCEQVTMAVMLQRLPLRKSSGRRGRRDMLLALSAVDREALAPVVADVPKNPDTAIEVHYLNVPEGSAVVPRYLVLLPQADTAYPWSAWLRSWNRRLGGGSPARLRLFSALPQGLTGDYFVEWDWNHPVPDLGQLYPNPRRAVQILIAAGPPMAGTQQECSAHWIPIVPRSGDSSLSLPGLHEDDAVEIHGLAPAAVTEAERTGTDRPLVLRASVTPLHASRTVSVAVLDERIQGVRETLFLLTQQRNALLEQEKDKSRLVTLFRHEQLDGNALPPRFRRFLTNVLNGTAELEYTFLEANGPVSGNRPTAAGASALPSLVGYHVLLSQRPVSLLEFPLGLADAVYVQPKDWPEEVNRVFVREGCRLDPRLDKGLAEKLALILPEPDGGGELLFLLDADRGAPCRATTVRLPPEAELKHQIEFLNTEFSRFEWTSRAEIRAALLKELDTKQTDFEDEVAEIERRLAKEATDRLAAAQRIWDGLAEELEHAGRHLQASADGRDLMHEIARSFAIKWKDFVDHVLDWNEALIREKLESLDVLERDQAAWQQTLDDVERSKQDVAARLEVLDRQLKTRRAEVLRNFAQARQRYWEVRKQTERMEDMLKRAIRQLHGYLSEAARLRKWLQARNSDVTVRSQQLKEQLLPILTDMTKRLEAAFREFESLIENIQAQKQKLADLTDQLGQVEPRLAPLLQQWQQEYDAAVAKFEQVQGVVNRVERQFQECDRLLKGYETQADDLEQQIKDKTSDLRRRQRQLLETAIPSVDRQLALLADALGEFEAAVRLLQDKSKQCQENTERLAETERNLEAGYRAWAAEHSRSLDKHDSLERLAEERAEAIGQIRGELDQFEQAAKDLTEDLSGRLKRSREQVKSLRERNEENDRLLRHWQDEEKTLRDLWRAIHGAREGLERQKGERDALIRELQDAAETLRVAMEPVAADVQSQLPPIVDELEQLAKQLRELAKMEEAIRQSAKFRRVVELSVNAAANFCRNEPPPSTGDDDGEQ